MCDINVLNMLIKHVMGGFISKTIFIIIESALVCQYKDIGKYRMGQKGVGDLIP